MGERHRGAARAHRRERECWPEEVEPLLTDVDVAISRTRPEHGGSTLVHEVELLWLAAIAAARCSIYVESQYFASRRIAEAIAERLREPDGPDVVVLNPWTADGWLSEKAMGTARARVLEIVREADVHDRFRLYTPVTEQREHIYVHAKLTVVDDRLLRLGSSNMNNRSMGLDTECDLAIEAVAGKPGADRLAATIAIRGNAGFALFASHRIAAAVLAGHEFRHVRTPSTRCTTTRSKLWLPQAHVGFGCAFHRLSFAAYCISIRGIHLAPAAVGYTG